MSERLRNQFNDQQFLNDYQLIDGIAMHAENPDQFFIPPDVIKRQIDVGHFVELRIDSPRFSVHEETAEQCFCPSCHGKLSKPILRHVHPASLVPLPEQTVPARGWGEDFWVRVTERQADFFSGQVDNAMVESRLHGLHRGDKMLFHADHILSVHDIHREELVGKMDVADLKEFAEWLRSPQGHA